MEIEFLAKLKFDKLCYEYQRQKDKVSKTVPEISVKVLSTVL